MKMRKLLLLTFTLFIYYPLFSQYTIETEAVLKKQSAFRFTAEWQYLSTDIFLMNAEKFTPLLNDIIQRAYLEKGKKMKKKEKIDLDKLLITANLKSATGTNVVYPIYSFQIQEDAEKKQTTILASTNEQIRLMDNLPMVGKSDIIEAEIKAEAFHAGEMSQIYRIISWQLQNIASFSSPVAALGLVAEFGKFMESNIESKSYQFSNTIRIYEAQDFNKRVHSVNVYVFKPSGNAAISVSTQKIENWVDTAKFVSLNKETLNNFINFKNYPIMVIVNYKSRYVSEPIVGDQIDFEKIDERRLKIEKAYQAKLINLESYEQEIKLLDFLKIFAQLKVNIHNFELNYKNKITEDFSKSYFIIFSELRKLKNNYHARQLEFANNKSFQNDFKALYEEILLNAELYLETNTNLKNIKELANVLYDFENLAGHYDAPNEIESKLRKIYAVEFPASEMKSEEILAIQNMIETYEQKQYNDIYDMQVKKLNALDAVDLNLPEFEKSKNMANATYCSRCKTELNNAILQFNERYEENRKQNLVSNLTIQQKYAGAFLFNVLQKEACIEKQVYIEFPDSTLRPNYIIMFMNELEEFKLNRQKLQLLIKNPDISKATADEIEEKYLILKSAVVQIEDDIDALCRKIPKYCECEN